MLTENREQRRSRLIAELKKRGVPFRADSKFCQAYISGTADACAEQVVATMEITRKLFRYGHRTWSENVSLNNMHDERAYVDRLCICEDID